MSKDPRVQLRELGQRVRDRQAVGWREFADLCDLLAGPPEVAQESETTTTTDPLTPPVTDPATS